MLIFITMIGIIVGVIIQLTGNVLMLEPESFDKKSLIQGYQQLKAGKLFNWFSFSMGVIAVLLYLKLGLSFMFVKNLFFMMMMGLIAYIDFKVLCVYRVTTIVTMCIGITFTFLEYIVFAISPISSLIGAFIGFAVIALIVYLTHGMGEGDIEIAALCGLFLGIEGVLLTLFMGIVFGGLGGVVLLLRRSKTLRDEMPFGPYLVAGAMISMIGAKEIIGFYLSLF
ncbi:MULTISPECIES: prepilin peptidase [unclassified Turicibacter]|jgi:leader peptidase (prepilin peptidase)/N-methyltransferase|uniref:prepilin peptidase n=1 Tax=unclassified Turicibacter TaxID=2638206 RepID=UPI0013796395|nr:MULTISPECIES: A24 family peptidase [unclassified Turicibacter]MCU7203693.1 A24 family peptidase [Turicibacter sp. TA25]MCU7208719.1 A24 family peptidase [Turicibacter sp. 1E2]NCE78671.1 prepilin peptidase [Turicibacter sp. TS3]